MAFTVLAFIGGLAILIGCFRRPGLAAVLLLLCAVASILYPWQVHDDGRVTSFASELMDSFDMNYTQAQAWDLSRPGPRFFVPWFTLLALLALVIRSRRRRSGGARGPRHSE